MMIIITVDVEGTHSQNPVDLLINGKINSEEFGISKIMDLCDYFQIKASFFIDVYEYSLHGCSVMKEVVEKITKRSHDIQLHTHPAWPIDSRDDHKIQEWKRNNCPFDPERPWMYQYDLNEQVEILNKGKELLERWINTEIIANRAGGYGANKTTLAAAKLTGLKMDFSAFRRHSNCRLKASANTITTIDGIVEVPTTGFYRARFLRFPKIPFKRRFVKTDIDWAFLEELKFYYEEGERHNLKFMVLFMHSYSFVKMSTNFEFFEPDYNEIRKFEKFIEWALYKKASFVTVNEFWNSYNSCPNTFQTRDYIPTYSKA